jgi:Na+/H+ antiporter NhaD/arsenite permease-like protein
LSILILFIFLIGYACIILEEWLTLDKTVPALLMGVLCWTGIALLEEGGGFNTALAHHIGVISEILLFLLGAMTIVELIDLHNGFDLIRQRISTQNTTRLLWIIAILSFLLSGILDNLTTAIVMVSILRKMIRNEEHRKYFAGIADGRCDDNDALDGRPRKCFWLDEQRLFTRFGRHGITYFYRKFCIAKANH